MKIKTIILLINYSAFISTLKPNKTQTYTEPYIQTHTHTPLHTQTRTPIVLIPGPAGMHLTWCER